MMLGLCAFWRACSGDCHLPEVVETTGPRDSLAVCLGLTEYS